MENTTHLFLATRFNCNKCHDHPFERWTQDQYYHLSAYFAHVESIERPGQRRFGDRRFGRRSRPAALRNHRRLRQRRGEARPHRRRQAARRSRSSAKHPAKKGETRREELADWITSADNPYFAKSYVNRIVGLPHRPRHHRTARRYPRRQPADESRAARLSHERIRKERLQHAAHDAADLQVAHVPIVGRKPINGTRTTRSTSRTPARGACRPKCCTTRSIERPERRRRSQASATGSPGGNAAGRRRRIAGRLPGQLWAAQPAKVPANASARATCSSAR